MNQAFPIEVSCPHCHKDKTFAERTSEGRMSCQCAVCQCYYIINLATMRAEKAKARASPNSPRKPTSPNYN
jgi:hypothetical protein